MYGLFRSSQWCVSFCLRLGCQGRFADAEKQQYIIMNLAISEGFGAIDVENLQFPATMSIDYVRVYQPKNAVNTGCDPKEFPTAQYIET